MFRHLQNTNELILYSSLSCLASFISREFPEFYLPILLLRLGIFSYFFWVIVHGEKNRVLSAIVGSALFIGSIGGYLDLIEVYFRFNSEFLVSVIMFALFFGSVIAVMIFHIYTNGTITKK